MKSKLIILCCVICSINFAYSQNSSWKHLDSLVNEFITALKAQNIDTICLYKDYCVGCHHITNESDYCSADIYIPMYIFWIKQGKTYLLKKDNCFDYSSAEIKNPYFWELLFKHKSAIKKEKIKPFQYSIEKQVYGMSIDHSYHYDFVCWLNKDSIAAHFDAFDLQQNSGIYQNINYEHNINLKSKFIIDKLKKVVLRIEVSKQLTKKRRE